MNNTTTAPILVAVEDAAIHAEAVHLAAATGRHVIDLSAETSELSTHARKSFALLVDASLHPTLAPAPNIFGVTAEVGAGAQPGVFVLPAQAADLLRAIGALGSPPPDRGLVIGVVGAAGGVGASTVAAALCRASNNDATLVDTHRLSGGLDLLLGIEHTPGARWGEIELGEGAVARADLRGALPTTDDGIALLTFPRASVSDPYRLTAAELERTVDALGAGGLTVVDASPSLLPSRCDLAVIVVPPEVRAVAAAARLVADCNADSIPNVLLVRDNDWAALTESEIEHSTRSRVVGRIRSVRGLTQTVERAGLPKRLPRHLTGAAEAVLGEVA